MTDQDRGHTVSGTSEVLPSAALARREALLKGVGKGVAVLGAVIPLQTLASQSVFTTTGKGGAPVIRCGISGMTSGVHSRETITSVCSGKGPAHYANSRNWPPHTNPDALCKQVFARCRFTVPDANVKGSSRPASLLEVLNHYPESDEAHWIAAWLNARGGRQNFPYSQKAVERFYYGAGPYPADQALRFFKTYMETS